MRISPDERKISNNFSAVFHVKRFRKRGRPRSTRPAIDLGTTELQRHRMELAPKDQTMATCPLDVALSRGVISKSYHEAANHFLACRAIIHPSPHAQAVDLSSASFGPGVEDVEREEKAETKFNRACESLRMQSRATYDAVWNFLVEERMPRWLVMNLACRDRDKVMRGLEELHKWHVKAKGRAA